MTDPVISRKPAALLAACLLAAAAGVAAAQAPGGPDAPPPRGRSDPEFKTALEVCAAEQGLPPPPAPGEAPEPEEKDRAQKRLDRKKFEACMTAKGFERPRRHGHDAPPPPPPPQD